MSERKLRPPKNKEKKRRWRSDWKKHERQRAKTQDAGLKARRYHCRKRRTHAWQQARRVEHPGDLIRVGVFRCGTD
jgi:hypothetical protein